jgi:hypothetical protein
MRNESLFVVLERTECAQMTMAGGVGTTTRRIVHGCIAGDHNIRQSTYSNEPWKSVGSAATKEKKVEAAKSARSFTISLL